MFLPKIFKVCNLYILKKEEQIRNGAIFGKGSAVGKVKHIYIAFHATLMGTSHVITFQIYTFVSETSVTRYLCGYLATQCNYT